MYTFRLKRPKFRWLVATSLSILSGIVGQRDLLAAGVPCAAEQKHEIVSHKGEHPLPQPSPNKALIVVMFDSHFGKSYQDKIAVDHRRWVAVLQKSEYTLFEMDPGLFTLSYYVRFGNFLKDVPLQVAANKIYFIRETLGDEVTGKLDISEVNEAQAEERLLKAKYVTFAAKGKMSEDDWVRSNTKFMDGLQKLRPGMTPADTYALLGGPGELMILDQLLKDPRLKDGRYNPSFGGFHGSVTIRSGVGNVQGCGYEFIFSGDRLQSWQ